jgi:transcriptional regulator with XRE-family HTH domain
LFVDIYLCIVFTTHMNEFGSYLRSQRERLLESDRSFSLRQVSCRVGIKPTYLSKIERGDLAPPSEEVIRKLATELGLQVDVLLAMGGKVSRKLQAIIMKRPELMGELLREIQELPDHAVLKVVREVKDGDW